MLPKNPLKNLGFGSRCPGEKAAAQSDPPPAAGEAKLKLPRNLRSL